METLKSGDVPALVTNIEVMQILSDRIEARRKVDEADEAAPAARRRRKQDGKLRHRDWLEESVVEYLHATPCAVVDKDRMPELVAKLKGPHKPTAAQMKQAATSTGSASVDPSGAGNDHVMEDEGENGSSTSQGGFDLTDGETLQVLNLMPQEPVEIHLLVEDLPSRMSDERQAKLLEFVGEYAGTEGDVDDQLNNAEEYGNGEEEDQEEMVDELEEDGGKGGVENGYR